LERACFLSKKYYAVFRKGSSFFNFKNLTIIMDYSRESQDRMKKIQDLKDAGVIPYANNYRGKIDIAEIRARSESDTQG